MERPSPFSSRLGTNHAATAEDMFNITKFLEGPISRLHELQEGIDRTTAHLNSLKTQHQALLREIKDHRALMAPIHRLPNDVIQEIFIHCLPETHNAVIARRHCPILLTRVCSNWRRLALDTAALWTSIHVSIPSDLSPDPGASPSGEAGIIEARRKARAITEMLGRSGACTLDISLYETNIETSVEIYEIILDALIPFCERWGTLACSICTSNFPPLITSLPANMLPRLHTLRLEPQFYDRLQPSLTPIDWKHSGVIYAPNLRNISFKPAMAEFFSLPLRWAQLTSISISSVEVVHDTPTLPVSLEDVAKLLTTCPLLRECCVEILPLYESYSQESDASELTSLPSTIFLPCLTHLTINAPQSKDLGLFFDALDVPKLEVFEFTVKSALMLPLLTLLERSTHTLHVLSITNESPGLSNEALLKCLSACVNLVELRLKNYSGDSDAPDPLYLDDNFLRQLLTTSHFSTTMNRETLLPRLAVFMCNSSTSYFSDACVLEVLRLRCDASVANGTNNSVAKLKRVDISFSRPQQIPLLAELDKLSREGVDCRFTFLHPPDTVTCLPTAGIEEDVPTLPHWNAAIF